MTHGFNVAAAGSNLGGTGRVNGGANANRATANVATTQAGGHGVPPAITPPPAAAPAPAGTGFPGTNTIPVLTLLWELLVKSNVTKPQWPRPASRML